MSCSRAQQPGPAICMRKILELSPGANLGKPLMPQKSWMADKDPFWEQLAAYFLILCNTAPAISGSPTVASSSTSANRPPSSGGTNLPHDTDSL